MTRRTNYDWSKFQIVMYYNAGLNRVYTAWSTSAGLCSFMLSDARFIDHVTSLTQTEATRGSKYCWRWPHNFVLDGTVIEARSDREFAFTFGSMSVLTQFSCFGEQTELVLNQTGIGTDDSGKIWGHLNCRSCWLFYLTNLKSMLEGGLDLRDAESNRASSFEIGFVPLTRA
jgi:uncharacterized protein YndB with AHSA1/START domain